MLPVQNKAYKIFDIALVGVSLLLVAAFILFSATELLGGHLDLSIYTAALSTAHILYMLGFYRSLRQRSVIGASLVGTIMLVANIGVLVMGTGAFNSPYYALWLMLTLAIGIYRPSIPIAFLAVTTLVFFGLTYSNNLPSSGFTSAVIALISTYITGGLGFWLWHSRHTRMQRSEDLGELSQELTEAQLQAEILIQQIGEGVLVVGRDGIVQLLNPAGEALTGWTEAEAKGIDSRLVLQLLGEDEQPLPAEASPLGQAILKAKGVNRDDLFLNTRSGKKLALGLTASPIMAASQVTGAIIVFRDITAAKASERQRNEFISTASHEMRTPVAAVEGYIALALNPKVAKIDDKAKAYLAKAQASIQHLGKLFQDLLSTTRIEEGKVPNRPEVVDISILIAEVVDELKFKAERKNLKLQYKPEGADTQAIKSVQPLFYAFVDPERVREVLTNLVDNAIKFTPKGSVIITADGDDKTVVVGVKDSGFGIAPEDMTHLFQKFYRIDNSDTRDIGGTGLGLYICRAIVEMYGGRIWVESKLGEGSYFKFSLPRLSFEKAEQLLNRQDDVKVQATVQARERTAAELVAPKERSG